MGRLFRKVKGSFDISTHNALGKENEKNIHCQEASSKFCIGWRYYIGTLGFLALCVVTLQRISLAVAIVNMVNFTSTSSVLPNVSHTACPLLFNSTGEDTNVQTGGEFDWSPELQGLILGAGFLGYALTPMVGGILANIIGAKQMLFWGNSLAALGMLVSPIASSWSPYAVFAAQLVRGMGQGWVLPAAFMMVANWAPRSERGFLSNLTFLGLYGGCVVAGPIAGFLCEDVFLGWRSTFYFSGGIGVFYSVLFAVTFYETPRDHPWISKRELKYITDNQESNENQKKPPIPWVRMFTSASTYALMMGMIGQGWILAYFMSVHSMYLGTILHYPIAQNGLLSSLPYILVIVGSLSASSASDWLYRRKYVGVNTARKGCTLFGNLGFGLSMAGIYAAECNVLLNLVFFAFAFLSAGVSTPGASIVAVDMTPNFAATLMGVLCSVCNLSGFIIPLITGYLTKDQTIEGWQKVFLVNIAVVIISAVSFAVFGSAHVQDWNFSTDSNETKKGSQGEVKTEENTKTTELQMNSFKSI